MFSKVKPLKFFSQVKQETRKVVWPDKKELMVSTIMVVVSVLIFSLASLVLDYGLHNLVQFVLSIGK